MSTERLLCYLLVVVLQSTVLTASFIDGNGDASTADRPGGSFLRGNRPPPNGQGLPSIHNNIFAKNKSRYIPDTKGPSYPSKGHTHRSKGHKHRSKGHKHRSKGQIHVSKGRDYPTRGKTGKSSFPHTDIFSPKSRKPTSITKGKGITNVYMTKGVIGSPLSKGKGAVVTKGKGKGFGEISCAPESISVESFQLVDVTTGRRLQTIAFGEELFLPELELQYGTTSFAIECVTESKQGVAIGSVSLSNNYGVTNIDNSLPWTLSGDNGFDFLATPFRENSGFWYVVCQPFCGPDATGAVGKPGVAWFTVSPGVTTASPIARPATTSAPTAVPATLPTLVPVPLPTLQPVSVPTFPPVSVPTISPSISTVTPAPTVALTALPTLTPLLMPTPQPVVVPTTSPVLLPTLSPTTIITLQPTTALPTLVTENPTTFVPSNFPTFSASASRVYGLQPNCAVFNGLNFNICLDLSSASGDPEPWFDLVNQAADRWERIISADPWGPWDAGVLSNLPQEVIATEIPAEGVDDIYIAIFEKDIDGRGGLFALAGPDLMMGDQIIAGSVQIDPNDIDTAIENQIFLPLMLHEIGHVLGIGTLWESFDLIDPDSGVYNGPNAVDAWRNEVGCSGDLPLSGNHWNEECMQNEFMTPFFRYNRPSPVSSITMGALEDLGYEVNRSEEDPFGLGDLGDCGSACPEANRRLATSNNYTDSLVSGLSLEGSQALLVGAAGHFRQRSDASIVSALYEENGFYYSRIVRREDADLYI
eukprot:scaffold1953_cov176-Amphora_coffeaeformis.AAC.15